MDDGAGSCRRCIDGGEEAFIEIIKGFFLIESEAMDKSRSI